MSLVFFDRFWLSFSTPTFPKVSFLHNLTFGNCVKILNFGKCEKIRNHRTVTADSQPLVVHHTSKALTGNYPEEANQEGIAASSR